GVRRCPRRRARKVRRRRRGARPAGGRRGAGAPRRRRGCGRDPERSGRGDEGRRGAARRRGGGNDRGARDGRGAGEIRSAGAGDAGPRPCGGSEALSEPALELRGIVKRFGGVAAVEGVSLSVSPGEVLALVGENGAGKSTLIAVACGLYRQDEGSVRAFGRELPPGDPGAAIEAGVGAVYQHFMLVPPLRVWENVVLGREPRWFGLIDAARARREVARAAEQSGLRL